MIPPESSSLMIYGNVLIESPSKLNFLKSTLPEWQAYWKVPAVVRVRGRYARDAADFFWNTPQVEIRLGSSFGNWRSQAYVDVFRLETDYLFLYQEDHMLHPNPPSSERIVRALYSSAADVFPYSWFESYGRLREQLSGDGTIYDQLVASRIVDYDYHRRVVGPAGLYPVSLSSIFRRKFLLRVLKSGRPFVRKFDPAGPFDVEQSHSATWILPLRLAFPLAEVGVCIDDDHLVPGSSAMSRGYYSGPAGTREYFHRPSNSITSRLRNLAKTTQVPWISGAFSRVLSGIDYLSFTAQAPIRRLLDFYKIRKILGTNPGEN